MSHACSCECEIARIARRVARDKEQWNEVQDQVDKTPEREKTVFAWRPMRCPTTKKFWWLRTVKVVERSYVRSCYGFGSFLGYYMDWQVALLEKGGN